MPSQTIDHALLAGFGSEIAGGVALFEILRVLSRRQPNSTPSISAKDCVIRAALAPVIAAFLIAVPLMLILKDDTYALLPVTLPLAMTGFTLGAAGVERFHRRAGV